jgi:hypothetical protein
MHTYQEEKEKIKEEMGTSISNIHVSFDMWTSPNCLAMLSVFAHYLDKDSVRRNRLIRNRLKEDIVGASEYLHN